MGQPVADVLQEKHPNMRVTPVEKTTCADFEEYKEVPELVPIDFSENDVTWVAYKLSGISRMMGSEAIELRNWLLCYGCASEEFRAVATNLADWMANYPPPHPPL